MLLGKQLRSTSKGVRVGGQYFWAVLVLLGLLGGAAGQPAPSRPYRVTIQDEKPQVLEVLLPIDPLVHIQYQPNGLGVSVRGEHNETLHLSHFPTVKIDDRVFLQGQGGKPEYFNRPLPPGPGGQPRPGVQSAFRFGDLRVTATIRPVPSRPQGKTLKRLLDTVAIEYEVENLGQQNHTFGLRIYMDVFIVNNDGALFAAPTVPGQILNGRAFQGKEVPPYLQLLQIPNLQNPGYVAHLTFQLGSRYEKPDRLVLTAFPQGMGGWEVPVVASVGDSALAFFWEPRSIPPGGKRRFAYAYGRGLAASLDGEGRLQLVLSGSFQPQRLFEVTAYVLDPLPGQSLTLQLPAGMELVEGPALQPVPPPASDQQAMSVVRWRGRVLRPGSFSLRVRSSHGLQEGRTILVQPPTP
jgi:hypothetical protein